MRERHLHVSYSHTNATGGGFGSIHMTITGPLDAARVEAMQQYIAERNNLTGCVILAWSEMDPEPDGGESHG